MSIKIQIYIQVKLDQTRMTRAYNKIIQFGLNYE